MNNIENKGIYLDYGPILSYQRFLTILTGGRGIGKTYGIKKHIIKRFIEHGEQFIWIRRYREELKIAKSGFFEKVKKEFPDNCLEVRGKEIYIDNKLAGVFCALSQNATNKGNDILNNARTAVFDEYIIGETKYGGYLPNEIRTLFDLLETFFRTNENTRMFVLSNNISEINPLYLYFGIEFKNNNTKWIDEDIYCEKLPTSEELVKLKSKTPMGRITKKYDQEYYNYNVNNSVLKDNENFIKEKPNKAYQCMTISFDSRYVYIYKVKDRLTGSYVFYASDIGQKDFAINFTFDLNKASEDVILVDKTNLSLPIKDLANAYKRGRLFFESQEIKSIMTENLKKFF